MRNLDLFLFVLFLEKLAFWCGRFLVFQTAQFCLELFDQLSLLLMLLVRVHDDLERLFGQSEVLSESEDKIRIQMQAVPEVFIDSLLIDKGGAEFEVKLGCIPDDEDCGLLASDILS